MEGQWKLVLITAQWTDVAEKKKKSQPEASAQNPAEMKLLVSKLIYILKEQIALHTDHEK